MNTILDIPLGVRLAIVFAVGAVVSGFVNLGIYRLAWNARSISPWSAPPPGAAPRQGRDRIPIVGWFFLRREAKIHGRGFWIRPLLVELAGGVGLAALYWWDTVAVARQLLMPEAALPRPDFVSDNVPLVLHMHFLAHTLLAGLMLVASLIDIDEKTIPDSITVPGTLAGLALATLYPWSLLPAGDWMAEGRHQIEFLSLAAPNPWPAALSLDRFAEPLAIAWGCWTLWCVALLPRRWNTRRGWRTALRVFGHRLWRERLSLVILAMWLAGGAAIALAAARADDARWAALLTALVGMAGGGGVIWAVRIIGGAALRREAMGFGDVTLMAMVGAFVGWQASLLVFFLGPFLGVLFAIAQWVMHGEHEIPYGPFLCLAALGVLVQWAPLWTWACQIFVLGWLVPVFLATCLALMGAVLWLYRLLRERVAGE